MRIIVKRCKVWWGDWRDGIATSELEALAAWGGLPNPNFGRTVICPFCGRSHFAPDGVILGRTYCTPCGELRLRSKRAIRKIKRLHKPSRKVGLFCHMCGWEGVWGRAETVHRIKEQSGWILCPDCQEELQVTNKEGVPRYVRESSFC